tara:strand:+ start:2637 stop:2948 length:312 start_codon:yes stop_codon:yes gene_type:complete
MSKYNYKTKAHRLENQSWIVKGVCHKGPLDGEWFSSHSIRIGWKDEGYYQRTNRCVGNKYIYQWISHEEISTQQKVEKERTKERNEKVQRLRSGIADSNSDSR